MKVEKTIVLLIVVALIAVASSVYSEPVRILSTNDSLPSDFINYTNYTLFNQTISVSLAPPVIENRYFLGEDVNIYLRNFSNISLVEITSNTASYKFAGTLQEVLKFKPPEIGIYLLNIKYGEKSYQKNFIIEFEGKVYTAKKSYEFGETIPIFFNVSNTTGFSLSISSGNDVFRSLGKIVSPFNFIPKNIGNYTIELYQGENFHSKNNFIVVSKKKKVINQTEEKSTLITFTADFKSMVEKKKTLIDRIFGINPVSSISFYILNHTQDYVFNLSLEKVSEYVYRGIVYPNENATTGLYTSVIEINVHGESINQTKQFYWENEEEEVVPEVKKNKSKLLKYSFLEEEDAILEVDFTNINIQRDILEQALKKPKIEKISAYLDGFAYDDTFKINFEHIEYDRFNVKISKKELIPGIYKLIVVAKTGEVYQFRDQIFNWGLEDEEEIKQGIFNKNKTTILNEVIRITKINQSENIQLDKIYTEKNKYQVNESVKLFSNANLEKVQIFSNNVSFFYTETFANGMSFAPPNAGEYTIQAIVKNKTGILSANFIVVDNIPLVLEKLNFSIRDNKNQRINSILKIYGEDRKLLREVNSTL